MNALTDATTNPKLRALSEAGVKYVLASFVDLHGNCKAKAVPLTHFEHMMAGSELFTGAALDGVPQEVNDEEVSAHPDIDGLVICPWNPELAWAPSDLYIGSAPFEACARGILKNVQSQAAELGL
ncbi:MAG: hypothetical protein KIT73_00810 [Burkholderiales bacterium]|nr:hypothetical protein [Burkholderiales bacterium]